jgi:hypothetical protein
MNSTQQSGRTQQQITGGTTLVKREMPIVKREEAGDRAALLEALSQRVLRHWQVDAWRQLFLGPAYASIRMETVQLTLLATDSPLPKLDRMEVEMLAQRLGGNPEAALGADLVLSFQRPSAALRAALVLQRLSPHRKVRTALASHACTVACFELNGEPQRLVIGAAMEHVERAVTQVAPGTIFVSPETYALVEDRLGEHVRDAIIATELDDQMVTQASITLAPQPSEWVSTFAGLGR